MTFSKSKKHFLGFFWAEGSHQKADSPRRAIRMTIEVFSPDSEGCGNAAVDSEATTVKN